MDDSTIIRDELLRRIIDVGQVDVLVGLATQDHAATVGRLVKAVRAAGRTHFPRLRMALLHVDHGSHDGTPLLASQAWDESGRGPDGSELRTSHYITATADQERDGDVMRVILAAADLLQAGAVVVLDPDSEADCQEQIVSLVSPIWNKEADVVTPVYERGAADALLVTQVVRPLTLLVFARRLAEPLIPTFACSGPFAAHCTQAAWNTSQDGRATRYWVVGEALSAAFQVRQCVLGPRVAAHGVTTSSLQSLFSDIMLSIFASTELHADLWLTRKMVEDVPLLTGRRATGSAAGPHVHAGRAPQSFADDFRNLSDILQRILSPTTFAAVSAASLERDGPIYPDALWAESIADVVTALHHGVMRRDHIAQALLPLYRARANAFVHAHEQEAPGLVGAALESLATAFETIRPRIVQQWVQPQEVQS